MAHSLQTIVVVVFVLVRITTSQDTQNKLTFEPNLSSSNLSTIQLDGSKTHVQSIKDDLVCSSCKFGLDFALWKFRKPDGTYPGLFKFIITMCKDLKIDSPAVCEGMVSALQNETSFLLTKLQLNGGQICGLIFPSKCQSSGLSWNDDKWTVPIPQKNPTLKSYKTKPREGSPLKVLHISDLHIDLMYEPGSAINCDDPLCCRKGQQVSKKEAGNASYWGSYGYCDVPYWTVENMLSTAAKTQKYDYILWTGDLPAHNVWSQKRSSQIYLIKNLTTLLLKYFPDTAIYPALGNHESDPVNSFPPSYVKGYNSISWLYDELVKAWAPWLPKDAIATVKQSGYYTTIVKPGFRIVSLNMNYCNNENFWMLLNPVDPNNELKWLVSVLTSAESKGESVHIIGHIPPSAGGDCLKVWRNNYYDIITRFKATVTAQFFGHTHTDEFEIFYADSSLQNPISMAYICPSVTTYTNSNPSYRTYDVVSNTWTVIDHHTYILNLSNANTVQSDPQWKLEYSAKSTYGLQDLTAESWHKVFKSWFTDTTTTGNTFAKYYVNFHKGHPPTETCDDNCKRDLLCRIAGGNFTNLNCVS
uniref:Sphingomyelin phosphodiesterase n=1 Tax=Phallusia mammillata TaxID=59560 RepID=A0A6F9DSI1_9ASCI|nr:sphingomyelin phosphodiesterase 1 [Phallusia mammillata]